MKGETNMKKLTALFLALTLLVGCLPLAFAEGATRTCTDSTGRTIELPVQIDRIAVSGALAKMIVFAIAPDKMVGVPTPWDAAELPFVPKQYRDMTIIGQLYGDTDPKSDNKAKVYTIVQELAAEFRAAHGSLICREILGFMKNQETDPAHPSERNEEFYKKRPCAHVCAATASLLETYLKAHGRM